MIERTLKEIVFSNEWGRQMRFIAGPRQSGKTTLARSFLHEQHDESFYYSWDDRELKMRFHRGADFLAEDLLKARVQKKERWVCYDEIHKMPKWKNILKAHFDAHEQHLHFIVTGSARLDLLRRSGDSLAGRYFLFHLFPFSLFELTGKSGEKIPFHRSAGEFLKSRIANSRESDQKTMETLLMLGGFPEPFLKGSSHFLQLWHRNYLDRLVREDLRDLTKIGELENVAALVALMPERIGSPLSINSLREDLSVNHATVRNYLQALRLSYVLFELPTHSGRLNRTLTKEKKFYFHDWSLVPDDGKRFENYAAAELLSWTSSWNDGGLGRIELRYIRTRDGQECDFLILLDSKPWLLLEAKLKAEPIPTHLLHFSERLGKIPVVMLVREKGVLRIGQKGDWCVSASRFFSR